MYLDEAVIYIDAIRAKEIEQYEAKIGDCQMQLAIQAGAQSSKGYKQMEKQLKRMLYQHREILEVEPKSNDVGWQQLIELDKRMRRK